MRGQGTSRLFQPGRFDHEPEHGLKVHAEDPVVDVDLEGQQPGPAELVHPAAHRRLVPVDRGGQRGVAGPPVACEFGEQRLVPGKQYSPAGSLARSGGRAEPIQLGGGQGAGDFLPRPGGKVVQDRVRGDLHDAAAAGQAAQEQGVALLGGPRFERARDFGTPGGKAYPAGVRAAGQGLRERVGTARGRLQPEEPAGPAQLGSVDHAEHAQPGRFAQPAVPAGGGLVGDSGHLGEGAEGRPGLDRQDVDNLPIDGIQHRHFHEDQRSRCRDPALSGLIVDYFRSVTAA